MPTTTPRPSTTEDNAQSTSQRDDKGRFTAGNQGGPGNPFARRVGELRRAMLMAVSVEKIQEIINALMDKATEGDVPAARLVLSYVLGKPETVADPDRGDAHEWSLEKE